MKSFRLDIASIDTFWNVVHNILFIAGIITVARVLFALIG